ncbi:hypothetical protein SAY86_032156 [Trapa natans]|uniref:Uncharacterized protein n=1 Tax=Trapa natans TaxID=22666 RepID=A0AAN7LMZ6_TRANT|nr:hypothetical protein SAY86_032156 [Trapa natans]
MSDIELCVWRLPSFTNIPIPSQASSSRERSLYTEVKKHRMFEMQSFRASTVPIPPPPHPPPPSPSADPEMYCHSSFFLRGGDNYNIDSNSRDHTRFPDFVGELLPPVGAPDFQHQDAVALSPSPVFGVKPNNQAFVGSNLPYGGDMNTCNINTYSEMGCVEESIGGGHQHQQQQQQHFMYSHQKVSGHEGHGLENATSLVNGSIVQNWGDSSMVMAPDNSHSQHTDTSTDVDTDDKPYFHGFQLGIPAVVDSMDQSRTRIGDVKTLRRLAQNREAARKSRLRKKAYVQQLEGSRIRLLQLEQELQRARQQGMFAAAGTSGDHSHSASSGAMAFDMEYARWLDEHQQLINELRTAMNTRMSDNELRILVDAVMVHYDEVFRLKSIGAKADVFHMLSGMWKTPAERCFMWLGGFRSSEILKVLGNHLEPLTDQQLMGICNLQQSSQQAEDALSQGMEALQQSLSETLSSATLNPTGSGNVADYMGQMAIAMGKLTTLENFLHQADLLRQQTLQQMHRILTTRQAARSLLVISDYMSRLRALSSLWLARPRDC